MLHNTLSALLVSVASRYAKLSPSDVGIGIGGGRLVIDNVQLRADVFNGPHIPFHVHQGRAGRLRVNVPWSALSSSPVQVYLENVHLIAGPKLPPTQPNSSSSATSLNRTDYPSNININSQASSSTPSSNLDSGLKNAHKTAGYSETSSHSLPSQQQQQQQQQQQSIPQQAQPQLEKHWQQPWHQTNVGRLLFNVSVEMFGLKVEYRDPSCVGIISIASLRAFSAGPDWQMRFVSLVPDLNRDQPDATAVAMRKQVVLTGVHFVMIPRSKHAKPATRQSDPVANAAISTDDSKTATAVSPSTAVFDESIQSSGPETKATNSPQPTVQQQQQQLQDAVLRDNNLDRNLDLNSFESQKPILDGISITVRVLLCTGATVLPQTPDRLTPGLHAEVHVDVDEPTVRLTARQLRWLDRICNQAIASAFQTQSQNGSSAKYVPSDARSTASTTDADYDGNERHSDAGGDGESTIIQHNSSAPVLDVPRRKRGRLRTMWDVIVAENSDETVDDAAIALGLKAKDELHVFSDDDGFDDYEDEYDELNYNENHNRTDADESDNNYDTDESTDEADASRSAISARRSSSGGNNGSNGAIGGQKQTPKSRTDDRQYARRAVQTAAECGGMTWELRVRTSDMTAWDRVKELEREVTNTRATSSAEQEEIRRAARDEVTEAQRKVIEAKAETAELVRRNAQLAVELKELETLSTEAGKGKDEIIWSLQQSLCELQAKVEASVALAKTSSLSEMNEANEEEGRPVTGNEVGSRDEKTGDNNLQGKDLNMYVANADPHGEGGGSVVGGEVKIGCDHVTKLHPEEKSESTTLSDVEDVELSITTKRRNSNVTKKHVGDDDTRLKSRIGSVGSVGEWDMDQTTEQVQNGVTMGFEDTEKRERPHVDVETNGTTTPSLQIMDKRNGEGAAEDVELSERMSEVREGNPVPFAVMDRSVGLLTTEDKLRTEEVADGDSRQDGNTDVNDTSDGTEPIADGELRTSEIQPSHGVSTLRAISGPMPTHHRPVGPPPTLPLSQSPPQSSAEEPSRVDCPTYQSQKPQRSNDTQAQPRTQLQKSAATENESHQLHQVQLEVQEQRQLQQPSQNAPFEFEQDGLTLI